jgi:predicted nucleic acid-binding protein
MLVFDTTVLLYAQGAEHPFRDPCRALVAAIRDERIHATTTIEVIQEFVHVRGRRYGRTNALEWAREYVELLSPLIPADRIDLDLGLDLYARHDRLGAFDAILAAVAINAGSSALVSADRAFADVSRLTHVFPDQWAIGSFCASPRAAPSRTGRRCGA